MAIQPRSIPECNPRAAKTLDFILQDWWASYESYQGEVGNHIKNGWTIHSEEKDESDRTVKVVLIPPEKTED